MEIDIKLGKYKGLKVKRNKLEVKEEEIKKALDYLQNFRAKIVTVNRPAKNGDRVEIDFEVRQGNVKIESGESKNHPLILGQGHFLPGFEKELEGMKEGQEKNFSLKAPDDWSDKRIADKNLDFKVKMKLVQKQELPIINDDFAKSLGNFQSLADLEESIKDGLMQEKEIKEKQRIRIELIEKIAENSEIEIPENLIDKEIERMVVELKMSIANIGLDFEIYLKQIKKNIDDFKKDFKEQAKNRIKISACLDEIAGRENIEVGDEEVAARINEDLKHYSNVEEAKKNIDLLTLEEYTKNVLRNEKVSALLEREATLSVAKQKLYESYTNSN